MVVQIYSVARQCKMAPKEKLERETRLCRGCLMMCGYGGLAWLSRLGTLGRLPVLGTPFRLGDRLPPGD